MQKQLNEFFATDADIHLAFPYEDLNGADELFQKAYQPLITAIPDMERRDFIMMAGHSNGGNWVGCAGHYVGTFEKP